MPSPDENERRVESPFFKPHPVLGKTLDVGEGLRSYYEDMPKWVFRVVVGIVIFFSIYEVMQILQSLGIVINDYL